MNKYNSLATNYRWIKFNWTSVNSTFYIQAVMAKLKIQMFINIKFIAK